MVNALPNMQISYAVDYERLQGAKGGRKLLKPARLLSQSRRRRKKEAKPKGIAKSVSPSLPALV